MPTSAQPPKNEVALQSPQSRQFLRRRSCYYLDTPLQDPVMTRLQTCRRTTLKMEFH
ncbi:unnamed protein product [Tenebrio molitor]|nr:unnamed protein product [Tenebrio molitor]